MSFPEHLDRILNAYGVAADTKAALYDLYLSLGDEVLEVFSDIAETSASVASLRPEDTTTIRARVVERYLARNHPRWTAGQPTASLWHPRVAEGRASGLAIPLGEPPEAARRAVGEGQSVPDGFLMLGRNAHLGGRADTISFDLVATSLDDALALARAEGQQHTLPGSAGETSGTFDSQRGLALLWEVQPNVYKPAGERNRAIARLYRRHRNWHLATLASALDWLAQQRCTTFILRGDALAATHEVNPEKPLSPAIAALHDRTVERVTRALALTLEAPSPLDELQLLDSAVMNHALRRHVLQHGAAGAVWRVMGMPA
ncbi:MAG: hypothetical protein JO197_17125 [Acidobacteria bacterium]|nr:hypothetical protein [Acidobacteriota bacterium]MBV9478453.1 hypothetical protein [Acidobacteriota bacterium]